MLMKDDPAEQLVYYQVSSPSLPVKSALLMHLCQSGIGTHE